MWFRTLFSWVMEKYDSFVAGTSMIGWTRAIVRRKVLQSGRVTQTGPPKQLVWMG